MEYLKNCHPKNHPEYPYILVGQVGHGETDHNYLGTPEDMNMERPVYDRNSIYCISTILNKSRLCKFILNPIKFINRDRPGSDLAAGVAAAFASYSLVSLKVAEDDAKDYLIRARSLIDFAIKYKGRK